ncbi:MAG: NAD-glutamate dehydrogenase, partial [Bdellovibrionales bacterium]|nr:NAD-glutamate dehydrogenase [Bdellovibrionales bacterium]
NDGTNDGVRVNAKELRADVIGEGGNLGLTQAARIEFAGMGGLLNTDAIDNSAGVDLSDHEVNLKILFSDLMEKALLTLEDRNALLEELAPYVVEDVLAHNRAHALVLTLGESRSKRNVAYFRSLIQEVHRLGYINRNLEQLPDDDQLLERTARGQGLSRPELAVCLSAVKIQVKREILQSELISDVLLQDFLLGYFPETLHEKYRTEILRHPLGKEIIATQVANYLIDVMGVTFVHRMCLGNSVSPVTVIKCALAAVLILNVKELLKELRRYNTFAAYDKFLALRTITSGNLRDATSWLISFHGLELTLEEMVTVYRPLYDLLRKELTEDLTNSLGGKGVGILENVASLKITPLFQSSVLSNGIIKYLFEMMWAHHRSPQDIATVATMYASVCHALQLQQVLGSVESMVPSNKWENELLANSLEDLRHGISLLTVRLIEKNSLDSDAIHAAIMQSPQYHQFLDTIKEMGEKQYSAAALSVLAKQITKYIL